MNQFMQQLDVDMTLNHFNLNEFAEEVTYTPASTGVPIVISGLYDEPDFPVQPDIEVEIISKRPRLFIRQVDHPDGKVTKGDTVVIRGVNYNVVDDVSEKLGTLEMFLHKVV